MGGGHLPLHGQNGGNCSPLLASPGSAAPANRVHFLVWKVGIAGAPESRSGDELRRRNKNTTID